MTDFLIALFITLTLIVFPVFAYWAASEYKLGRRWGEWWFKRNHTFPDKPNANETRKMALTKDHSHAK